jgi:hypothetical protein
VNIREQAKKRSKWQSVGPEAQSEAGIKLLSFREALFEVIN